MQTSNRVQKILFVILILNLFVAILKIIIGNTISSSSLTADGYHSLSDGLSNVVGLIGIYLAMKPVDRDHPYGHKKFENMTSLLMGFVLIVFSAKIAWEAIEKIHTPSSPNISAESFLFFLLTLFINIFVATYEHKKGIELNSDILIADSTHTKSDIFVTIGVLFTLLAINFGAPPIIDPIISLVVVVFILFGAFSIIKRTSAILVDSAAVEVAQIKNIMTSFSDVVNVHAIRSRRAGNDIFVDMHIWVDPNMTITKSHNLVHNIENKLRDAIHPDIQVIIHVEPDNKKTGYK